MNELKQKITQVYKYVRDLNKLVTELRESGIRVDVELGSRHLENADPLKCSIYELITPDFSLL